MLFTPRLAAAVDLSRPGRYLHWSIFLVSEANLVLIGVMVAIFGLALVLPFPSHGHDEPGPAGGTDGPSGAPAGADGVPASPGAPAPIGYQAAYRDSDAAEARMWTARLRGRAVALLPPGKLLPDRQPAYVASWVYVFGVASLVTLGMAIVSGLAIALGGTDWWHVNPVGHFFNSIHLWSVELFMALMVIHLWGKFWMAAWRGRRTLTWVTGVVAFVASVVECFTGYLSQQNFDSQWISTNGKDAVNALGLGSFFNLMNFGQMLLWHVVLVPLVLVAIVGAHVLLVRVRGVSHPLPEHGSHRRAERRAAARADAAEWRGPTRRYDIVKEATIASGIAFAVVLLLAGLLSSPDLPPVTIASWAKVAPADFLATAASELAGTSETATYGPPYNHGTSNVQRIGVSWQTLAGVREPIDPASAFVLSPLSEVAPTDPTLARALSSYRSAPVSQRQAWDKAYLHAVTHVRFHSGAPVLPRAVDGPVPELLSTELTLAHSGALDASLTAHKPFYGTNYTEPLLFLEDGEYFAAQAQAQHLTGSQWGVMNETGSYPGQPWIWLYTLWYQVPGFSSSPNVDLIAIYLTAAATVLLLAVPFVPGIRDIPRWVPLHRLVWRSWYRGAAATPAGGAAVSESNGGQPGGPGR
ncbi:MAG: cytochrome b N-terminal domain-containing protein [Acidimicrobiales bacterium]